MANHKRWAWQVWSGRGSSVLARGESDSEIEAKAACELGVRRERGAAVRAWEYGEPCRAALGRGEFSDREVLGVVIDRQEVVIAAESASR